MKKTIILPIMMALVLFVMPSALALISSVTINFPTNNLETNTNQIIFNVTGVWTYPTNMTNVTIWRDTTKIGTNSTINGTRISPTTGDFTIIANVAGWADGEYTIKAEARNDSDTITPSSSLNSSAITITIDRTNPTCKIAVSQTRIAPFKQVEVDISTARGTTDTNTLNTSATNLYVESQDSGTRTSQADTTGISAFSGTATQDLGEYAAGGNVTDNAGNKGSCTEETFLVTSDKNELQKTQATKISKPFKVNNLVLYGFFGFIAVVAIIILILIGMHYSKK